MSPGIAGGGKEATACWVELAEYSQGDELEEEEDEDEDGDADEDDVGMMSITPWKNPTDPTGGLTIF